MDQTTTYFGNTERQLEQQDKNQEDYADAFYIHENPQFLIQNDKVKVQVLDKDGYYKQAEQDQYYYITNDNQFMLVYPNYQDSYQKHDIILQIAKKHTYHIYQEDQEYNYEDDLKKRKDEYFSGEYKKISHVCYDNYRSKNWMKKSSHLYDIIYDRKIKPGLNDDRFILSTDEERSSIYVYRQSFEVDAPHFTNKHDSGDWQKSTLIDIFEYPNNIDFAMNVMPKIKNKENSENIHVIPKLPKQVQQVQLEDQKFIKQQQVVEDQKFMNKNTEPVTQCYYLNSMYKNVVSSRFAIQTQSMSFVDQTCHSHQLNIQDASQFALIEGSNPHDQ